MSLQFRVLQVMALGTALSLTILGTLGYLAVRQTIDRSLADRKVLALSTATQGPYQLNTSRMGSLGGCSSTSSRPVTTSPGGRTISRRPAVSEIACLNAM